MRQPKLISCYWDARAGEILFRVHEAFHTLPVEDKVAAMDDVSRQLAETRAGLNLTAIDPFKKLSPGEREVIAMTLRGMKNHEIADVRQCTVGTVDSMRSRALRKTGVRGMVQLAVVAGSGVAGAGGAA